jgi:hypothetical protein
MRSRFPLLQTVAAKILFAAVASAYAQVPSSLPSPMDRLERGHLGLLRVGMTSADLERVLARPLLLQFAGANRAAFTIEAPSELGRVGLKHIHGASVAAVDVFLKESSTQLIVDHISVGVPCSAVPSLRSSLPTMNRPGTKPASATDRAHHYAWGVESTPTCRVWLGEA